MVGSATASTSPRAVVARSTARLEGARAAGGLAGAGSSSARRDRRSAGVDAGVPQLERQLVVLVGLGQGVARFGRQARLHGGHQGAIDGARRPPVVGQLGPVLDAGAGPRGHEVLGVGGVVPTALAREHVGVHRLVQQGVAELVAPGAGVGGDHVGGVGLAQGVGHGVVVEGRHGHEGVVVEPPPGGGGDAQDQLGVGRQLLDAGEHHVAQQRREVVADRRRRRPAPRGRTGCPRSAGRSPR